MRLTFPNAELADVVTQAGIISLGSNAENTIVLGGEGVAPLHAYIFSDARGLVLNVMQPARVHVNARPVREKALLRLGDVISIDTVQILLKPDDDALILTDVVDNKRGIRHSEDTGVSGTDVPRGMPSRVSLRGISGSHFGRIVALRGRLSVGSGSQSDLRLDDGDMPREHAAIELVGDVIQLRDLGSNQPSRVNGVVVRDARLHAGDQIEFARNRFVIEAPGMPSRAAARAARDAAEEQLTQSWRLPDLTAAAAPPTAPRGEIWWLIGAAALIGIAIAAALLVKL